MEYKGKQIKFYFQAINQKSSFSDELRHYKEKCVELGRTDIKFVYLFEEADLIEDKNLEYKIRNIYDKLKSNIKEENIIISFRHNISNSIDNNKTCKKLYHLTLKFPFINMGLEDGDKTWNMYEIIKANQKLDDMAEKIKKSYLSPAEKLLVAYWKVTSFVYEKEAKNANSFDSRAIYSLLKSGKIVCVGYVELLKELLIRIDKDNIHLFDDSVIVSATDNGHRRAIIYIKDEKYNLDGYYSFDPTMDSKDKDAPQKYTLASFLTPLSLLKYSKLVCMPFAIAKEEMSYYSIDSLDTSTGINLNFKRNTTSSIVYGDARLNEELLTHMCEHCKELKDHIKQENMRFNKDKMSNTKQMLIDNPKLAFDILSRQSAPIKTGHIVMMIHYALRFCGFTKEECIPRTKTMIKNNIYLEKCCYNKNDISCFAEKNVNEFMDKNPTYDIRENHKQKDETPNKQDESNKNNKSNENAKNVKDDNDEQTNYYTSFN